MNSCIDIFMMKLLGELQLSFSSPEDQVWSIELEDLGITDFKDVADVVVLLKYTVS
jgi:hypothetical protein